MEEEEEKEGVVAVTAAVEAEAVETWTGWTGQRKVKVQELSVRKRVECEACPAVGLGLVATGCVCVNGRSPFLRGFGANMHWRDLHGFKSSG